MSNDSGLVSVGWLFTIFGAVLMVVTGFILIIQNFILEFNEIRSYLTLDFVTLDQDANILFGIFIIFLGIIVLWVWRTDRVKTGNDLVTYGFMFMILGFISALSLAGILVFVGGALFLIEYYF